MTKNIKFWIPKNRYNELRYHCLQYFYFKKVLTMDKASETLKDSAKNAIFNIESAIQDVNCSFGDILLNCVTSGTFYSDLPKDSNTPDEETFNDAWRKFFYFLSKRKGI